MLLLEKPTIAAAIQDIAPSHIAVAYIGTDWEEFIDTARLKQLIVSPTIGTNPHALKDVAQRIGWENVFFLDELHAKLYLSTTRAALGSFNLTANGIGVGGLIETGIIVDQLDAVAELFEHFEHLRSLAEARYPTTDSKRIRLQQLTAQWNHAHAQGILLSEATIRSLHDYIPNNSRDFDVCWFRNVQVDVDLATIRKAVPELTGDVLEEIASDWTTALDDDPVEENSWVLLWQCRNDGLPNNSVRLRWLYVHKVVRKAVDDGSYTTLLFQIKGGKIPPAPFCLTPEADAALKAVLKLDAYCTFRPPVHDAEAWSLVTPRERLVSFIEEAKRTARKTAELR